MALAGSHLKSAYHKGNDPCQQDIGACVICPGSTQPGPCTYIEYEGHDACQQDIDVYKTLALALPKPPTIVTLNTKGMMHVNKTLMPSGIALNLPKPLTVAKAAKVMIHVNKTVLPSSCTHFDQTLTKPQMVGKIQIKNYALVICPGSIQSTYPL